VARLVVDDGGRSYPLEWRSVGDGVPVTVFAHGLGASIAETRTLASGVPGTRVFLSFRGHGESGHPGTGWSHGALARELRAVADETGATQALGVSMGAGALLRIAAEDPGRFERLVVFLPAAFDQRRGPVAVARAEQVSRLAAGGRVEELAGLLLDEQPAAVRDQPAARAWVWATAERLCAASVAPAAGELVSEPAVSPEELGRVRVPCLVVGQEHDRAHPVSVARRIASALPDARLEVFPDGAALWLARRRLRALLSGFLGS
jgi:pimeloyl-ACP methyl ester carboxylesterase